jgi:threonine-phosphate decarboxylase
MNKEHQHGGDVFRVARALGIAPEELIDFSASINPLGMAPGVRDALAGSLERLVHYPDKGAFELRERLAGYHGISADEVTAANGSTELIHLLPRILPGKRGLIVAPAFAEYAASLDRAGWEVDYLTLDHRDRFAFPLSRLAERLSRGCDLLFLCNPANPSGTLLDREQVREIMALCRQSGTFLVLDEAFIDFCEDQSAKALMVRHRRGVLLRSMTKFFAIPGLRLGYAIGNSATIARIDACCDPWSVNTAAQVAGIASLADPDYPHRTRSYVAQQRARLAAGIDALGWAKAFPSQANYLLAEILDGPSAQELRERLLVQGVLIRDCANFKGLDRSFFRVAVRLEEENRRLLELLAGAKG